MFIKCAEILSSGCDRSSSKLCIGGFIVLHLKKGCSDLNFDLALLKSRQQLVVPNYQHVCLKFEKKKVEILYIKNKFKKIKKYII
jgi:hypothetical protein